MLHGIKIAYSPICPTGTLLMKWYNMKTAHSWLANITCWYFPWSQVTHYLRQYLCKIWGQHSGAAETSGLLGCDTASGGWVATDTLKDHSAFIFRVKESKKSHYLTSEMKTIRSFTRQGSHTQHTGQHQKRLKCLAMAVFEMPPAITAMVQATTK
jgi:hypothetical protein